MYHSFSKFKYLYKPSMQCCSRPTCTWAEVPAQCTLLKLCLILQSTMLQAIDLEMPGFFFGNTVHAFWQPDWHDLFSCRSGKPDSLMCDSRLDVLSSCVILALFQCIKYADQGQTSHRNYYLLTTSCHSDFS